MLVQRQPQAFASAGERHALPVAGQGGAPGERLEAADVAAPADHRRVVDDLDVPDVAGRALRPAVDAAVRDDPGADAGADLDDDDVVMANRDPRPPLAEGEDVHVVVDPDRRPIAVGESLADRISVPARHDRRADRPPGAKLDGTGHADADAPEPAGQVAGRGGQLREQLVDAGEAAFRPGRNVGRLVAVAEDPAVEVRDGHVDAGRPEIGDQQMAGIGAKAHPPRRAAARARAGLGLDDEAELHQLVDALGDDAPRQARTCDELGA